MVGETLVDPTAGKSPRFAMLTLVALVVLQVSVELCRRKMDAGWAENCIVGAALTGCGCGTGVPFPLLPEFPPPAHPIRPLIAATTQNNRRGTCLLIVMVCFIADYLEPGS